MFSTITRLALIAALTIAGTAYAIAVEPATIAQTDKGDTLVDASGMTLYIFDKDTDGKSACYDECAVKWPPLAAVDGDKAEGDYTVISRTDGLQQWAYNGRPLYTWFKDVKAGDTTGDGVMGVWHVAKP